MPALCLHADSSEGQRPCGVEIGPSSPPLLPQPLTGTPKAVREDCWQGAVGCQSPASITADRYIYIHSVSDHRIHRPTGCVYLDTVCKVKSVVPLRSSGANSEPPSLCVLTQVQDLHRRQVVCCFFFFFFSFPADGTACWCRKCEHR